MPNSRNNNRKEPEKNRKGRLIRKSSSFHGMIPTVEPAELRRPNTLPDLFSERTVTGFPDARPKLTKLLLNVTIQGSLGAVQVLMSSENNVDDLITDAVRQYSKECRRPILPSTDASLFDLHYSQFSLESLERDEKLMTLGSRNFFLCTKKAASKNGDNNQTTSCSEEAEKVTKELKVTLAQIHEFLI